MLPVPLSRHTAPAWSLRGFAPEASGAFKQPRSSLVTGLVARSGGFSVFLAENWCFPQQSFSEKTLQTKTSSSKSLQPVKNVLPHFQSNFSIAAGKLNSNNI